jgi:hypothetical protein
MQGLLRAVFVWVMVIAMPAQGMAASLMLLCGPSHARMAAGLLPDAPPAATGHGAAGHGPTALAHGVHRHAALAVPCADGPTACADAGAPAGQSAQADGFSCSACAACCHALALPASLVLPAPSSPAHSVQMAPVQPVASHQPDGLDRPPRSTTA